MITHERLRQCQSWDSIVGVIDVAEHALTVSPNCGTELVCCLREERQRSDNVCNPLAFVADTIEKRIWRQGSLLAQEEEDAEPTP
jgi:hypothetical protein